MPKASSIVAMSLAAFAFWETMDKVHVWIALHQDEKQDKLREEAEVRRMRAELLQQQKEQDSLIPPSVPLRREPFKESGTNRFFCEINEG